VIRSIISRIDFIEKFFEQKLYGLKGDTWWKCGLEWSCQNQIKVIIVFLNENLYFLLHILIAYLESFPKHYNKVTFHWVLSEWELWRKSYSTTSVIHVRMRVWAGFLRAHVSATYPHCLTYAHAHGIESNSSHLNDSTFLFFSYSFFFQFFYIGLFQSFFQNGRLQFQMKSLLFLCLVKLDDIIVEQKDCIVISV